MKELDLRFINLDFLDFYVRVVIIGERNTLESEGWKLDRLLHENLLKSNSNTKFIVNKPNLVEIHDGRTLLTIIEGVEGNPFLPHIISLEERLSI